MTPPPPDAPSATTGAGGDIDIEFEPRMSASDALMWNIEKDPLLRSTIVFVSLLDREPDRDRMIRTIDRATRLVPRLRQRVVGHALSIAPPRWEIDPNFDLHYHLRWMRVTGDGTRRELLDIAEPIAMQGFDRARPLWEFTVVEGLEGDCAALIGKVHHAITDGVGGIRLQLALVDLERDPTTTPPLPDAPVAAPLSEYQRWLDAIGYEGTRQMHNTVRAATATAGAAARLPWDPVGVLRYVVRSGSSLAHVLAPTTEPLSPVMVGRSLSVRFHELQVPLERLKDAGRSVGGKLNDAFVTALTGGLARYHRRHGRDDVTELRMNMPINIRTDATARVAGNQFVPARFAVPIGIDEPLERMAVIRTLLAHERDEPALAFTDIIADLLNRLPTTITTAVFGTMLKGVDVIATNVPGAPVPVYVAGAEVQGQIAFAPLAGAAVNAALLSHCGTAHVGLNVDRAAVPDDDVFFACVREGFDEVLALA